MARHQHRNDRFSTLRTARLTRRATVRAGGLAAAAALTARSVAAYQQDDLPEVIASFVVGWETLDADQIAATYAEDGTHEDIVTGAVYEGRDAIHGFLTGFIGAFADATAEVPEAFAAQDHAAASWIFNGNYTGMLPGFPPGEGQPVTIHGFTLIDLRNDLIQRTVDYFDAYGILVQLGVVPPPAGATPAG